MIQSVALSHALKQLGFTPVFLNRRKNMSTLKAGAYAVLKHCPFQNINGVRTRTQIQAFHKPFLRQHFATITPDLRSETAIRDSLKRYDLKAVVVGSDQVWRAQYIPEGCIDNFFLDFVEDDTIQKVSYAASFGVNQWEDDASRERIKEMLQRFNAVSVRERSAVDVCRDTFGYHDAVHVLDPTMLISADLYKDMASPSQKKTQEKVVLSYLLDRQPADEVARAALGNDYKSEILTSDDIGTVDLPHWLRAFIDADFVITDSFHGTVFALIFQKQFISIVNHDRGADRFYSLLEQLGLENRMIDGADTQRSEALVAEPIDYEQVSGKLDQLRKHSLGFLSTALGRT